MVLNGYPNRTSGVVAQPLMSLRVVCGHSKLLYSKKKEKKEAKA
jgi:hypothetical protein